jgi:hypothetical protein
LPGAILYQMSLPKKPTGGFPRERSWGFYAANAN